MIVHLRLPGIHHKCTLNIMWGTLPMHVHVVMDSFLKPLCLCSSYYLNLMAKSEVHNLDLI